MARIRYVKPDFFTDEDVVELEPLTRLLFIGMWTLADREGRMDDKPKQIKMKLLPSDNHDIEQALQDLTDLNFIVRYSVEGKNYIQIRSFAKHQKTHHQEPASCIPACTSENLRTTSEISRTTSENLRVNRTLTEIGIGIGTGTEIGTDKTTAATARARTKTELLFETSFLENESRLKELYPADCFEIERETCIAHYRDKPPPIDVYPVILKWFNRSTKLRGLPQQSRGRASPVTFEQAKLNNTLQAMQDFVNGG
jgi:hypothetical protein